MNKTKQLWWSWGIIQRRNCERFIAVCWFLLRGRERCYVQNAFNSKGKIMEQKGQASLDLGVCEFHQSYFETKWTLEINRKSVSRKVHKRFLSVVQREFNSCHHNLLHCALFSLRQSYMDLMTFQTVDLNVQRSQELDFRLITTSKNNLSEIPTSWPTL